MPRPCSGSPTRRACSRRRPSAPAQPPGRAAPRRRASSPSATSSPVELPPRRPTLNPAPQSRPPPGSARSRRRADAARDRRSGRRPSRGRSRCPRPRAVPGGACRSSLAPPDRRRLERADRRVHLERARARGRRRDVRRLGERQLRAAGEVLGRGQEGRLQGLGLDRLVPPDRHVRRRGGPARQREVQGGAGAAGDPRRPRAQAIVFTSSPPANAVAGGPAYSVAAVASSGLPVGFAAGREAAASARSRARRRAERRRHVHDRGRAGRQRRLRPCAPSAAVLRDRRGARGPAASSRSPSPRRLRRWRSSAARSTPSPRPRAPVSRSASPPRPSSAGMCTVSGAVVAFVGEGTCTVLAQQGGDDLYLAAPTASSSRSSSIARPRR